MFSVITIQKINNLTKELNLSHAVIYLEQNIRNNEMLALIRYNKQNKENKARIKKSNGYYNQGSNNQISPRACGATYMFYVSKLESVI